MNNAPAVVAKYLDVSQEEGKLPNVWQNSPDIQSLRSVDRPFVFPGEQVHVLACLSTCGQDVEVITSFKVDAVNKNGRRHGTKSNNAGENGEVSYNGNICSHKLDANQSNCYSSKGERQREHSRDSRIHIFFVRFADSDDALGSRRTPSKHSSDPSRMDAHNSRTISIITDKHLIEKKGTTNLGSFNANAIGGMARNSVKCFSLANGDIVVVLQVKIGDDFLQDPLIEICQFEKYSGESLVYQQDDDFLDAYDEPCSELLTWLFPLDNTFTAHTRSLSNSPISSSGIGSTSERSHISSSSGSQIFSFGNFKSYSMSSLPQSTAQAQANAHSTTLSSTSKFELEERDRYSSKYLSRSQIAGKEGLLSFRGVSLEPKRFSVCCGLEGVYIPGRRWRRKIQVIRPVEIHSFPAVCNTDDLLCVQIKNVCPSYIPEIVVYIDAVTIVLEETTRLIASTILANCYYGSWRRDEEHSFVLKPDISTRKKIFSQDRIGAQSSRMLPGNALKHSGFMKRTDGKESDSNTDRYSIMVLTLKASNLTSEDVTMTMLAPASFTSPPFVLSLNSSPTSPASPMTGTPNASGKARNEAGAVSLPSVNDLRNCGSENKVVSLHDQVSPLSDTIPSAGFGCSHLWLQSTVPLGCVPSQSTATIMLRLLPLADGIITLDSLQIDVQERGVTYAPEHPLKIIAT